MIPANALLAEAVRHALNDGECADWFARAHEPREHLLREGADGDGFEVSGFIDHHGSLSK